MFFLEKRTKKFVLAGVLGEMCIRDSGNKKSGGESFPFRRKQRFKEKSD